MSTAEEESVNTTSPEAEEAQDEVQIVEDTQKAKNTSITSEERLGQLRGDAIGDTLFSERFVLRTLINLSKLDKSLQEDEAFENDLCVLWDMTLVTDVSKVLLEHSVLEVFSGLIQQSDDKRLIEILMGIIGNMCNYAGAREHIRKNKTIMTPILNLISCTDALTLIQLMRLFHTVFALETVENSRVWFDMFEDLQPWTEQFAYILSNSCNETLLKGCLEALNSITFKHSELKNGDDDFPTFPLSVNLVKGVLDAFKSLMGTEKPEQTFDDSDDEECGKNDTIAQTKANQEISTIFVNLHVIFSQENEAVDVYDSVMNDLLDAISSILSPLCEIYCLLPLTNYETCCFENLNDLFDALSDPFHEKCFLQFVKIWELFLNDAENKENDEFEEPNEDCTEVIECLLQVIGRLSAAGAGDPLVSALKSISKNTVKKLLTNLEDNVDAISAIKSAVLALKK